MSRIKFLNTYIDNLTMEEALLRIDELIKGSNHAYVVTPNVDHIVKLEKDEKFRQVYNDADLILADGMPLIWISKVLKTSIKEKVSGSDLFPKVCEMASQKKYSIFLLGAAEGVAEKAAEKLCKRYKGLKVVGVYSPPYGFEKNENEIAKIIDMVKSCKPKILAVGVGAPKQEKFIYKYKEVMNVPISLAVGASIDFEAGNVKRAPLWMQKSGLEWLYRLCKEPKRMFRRYLIDDLKIVKIVIKYRKQFIKR